MDSVDSPFQTCWTTIVLSLVYGLEVSLSVRLPTGGSVLEQRVELFVDVVVEVR